MATVMTHQNFDILPEALITCGGGGGGGALLLRLSFPYTKYLHRFYSAWNNPSPKSTGLQLWKRKKQKARLCQIYSLVSCTGCCSLLLHEWRIFQTFKWHPFLILYILKRLQRRHAAMASI